jgi:cytochrome c biogenesis protein CcmG/thiol:disulfide interchange protein DsbE
VVNIWASWCAPCRDEHPLLGEVAAMPGVRLVGINYKDQPENARRFLGQLGNPFAAVGADVNGRAAIDWGVYGVPESFVIAPDGSIAYKQIGPLTEESLKGSFRDAVIKAQGKR